MFNPSACKPQTGMMTPMVFESIHTTLTQTETAQEDDYTHLKSGETFGVTDQQQQIKQQYDGNEEESVTLRN